MEQDSSHQNCAALARSVCTHVAGLTAHSVTLASGRGQFACPALVTPLTSTFGSLRQSTRMSLTAFRYEVFGKVQGVFFRATTAEEAKKLELVGWVMNSPSGSVKGEAQGDKDKMGIFRDFLQHKGSPDSRIDRCDITDERSIEELSYDTFAVRR